MGEVKSYTKTLTDTAGNQLQVMAYLNKAAIVAYVVYITRIRREGDGKLIVKGRDVGAREEFDTMQKAKDYVDRIVKVKVAEGWKAPLPVAAHSFEARPDSFGLDSIPPPPGCADAPPATTATAPAASPSAAGTGAPPGKGGPQPVRQAARVGGNRPQPTRK